MTDFKIMRDVDRYPQPMVWRNWILDLCVNIVQGHSQTYKSTFLSDVVSRMTSNQLMPDGTQCEAPGGGCVWISYEEIAEVRMAERFEMQGADMSKIIDLSTIPGKNVPFMLPDHVNYLRDAVKEVHASMVVIDPLMSMSNPKLRLFGEQASRQALSYLSGVAKSMGTAVVLINHTRRGNFRRLQSGAGSQAFSAFARSIIMLEPDLDNPKHIVASLEKHSNGPGCEPLVFQCANGSNIEYLDGLTPAQAKAHADQRAKKSSEKVLELLAAHPQREFRPNEISQELDVEDSTMRSLLRRMASDGEIAQAGYGQYKTL